MDIQAFLTASASHYAAQARRAKWEARFASLGFCLMAFALALIFASVCMATGQCLLSGPIGDYSLATGLLCFGFAFGTFGFGLYSGNRF